MARISLDDTIFSVPQAGTFMTGGDRLGPPCTDPGAAVNAIVGDLRQPLQVIISAHDVLAHSLAGAADRVQLELIRCAVRKLAAKLDRISNGLAASD